MIKRKRVMAFALEAEVGAGETLDATDAVSHVVDAVIQPEVEFIGRVGSGSLSPEPGVPGTRAGSAKFGIQWHGSGAAESTGGESVPAWANVLLPACAMVCTALAKNVFKPITGVPAVADYGQRTVTIGCFIDGTLRQITGAMGNAVFHFEAGKIVLVDFDFKGVWVAPTTTGLVAPTYSTLLPVRAASMGLAITEDAAFKVNELVVDLGNEVQLRADANAAAGIISGVIPVRRIHGTVDPEAVAAAQTATHTNWLASAEQQLNWTIGGVVAGNSAAFDLPQMQFENLQEADRSDLLVNNISFQANRVADTGDDEFSITFA